MWFKSTHHQCKQDKWKKEAQKKNKNNGIFQKIHQITLFALHPHFDLAAHDVSYYTVDYQLFSIINRNMFCEYANLTFESQLLMARNDAYKNDR